MRDAPTIRRIVFAGLFALAIPASAFAQRGCDEAHAAGTPSSGWMAPLDTRVKARMPDVSLREALDRLSAVTGVELAYSADRLPVDRRVCVLSDGQPLGELLTSLLRGTSVRALVVAGRVVLSPSAESPSYDTGAQPHGVSVLERVVVTGNAVAAPRRPLTIGVEVIDGDQLRSQALGSMAELLNATVPGMWAWSQSPSTMVAQYGGIRGASSFNASYPKIYIDGVEVANPLLVTQLNPDVVDRVEVIRGPQGAALYGSDAISGVINVLTRHDGVVAGMPYIQLRSTAGATASAYASGLVPTHEQRLSLRAGSNVRSAGLAMSFGQTGALIPSSQSRQIAATGDARIVTSQSTFTATARLFETRAGIGVNPLLSGIVAASGSQPSYNVSGGATTTAAQTISDPQSMGQYTFSMSAAFAPQGIWTHSLLAGLDGYHLDHVADSSGPFPSSVDSALRAARGNGDRMTFRESSVAHFGGVGASQTTLTLGVEQSVLRQAGTTTTSIPVLPGQVYPGALDAVEERWNHDTGLLSQLSSSWNDALFVTAGLRVERNDNFSGNNRYPLLPMLGLAGVRTVGGAELKLRAAYGKGIRPPQTPARSAASGYAGNTGSTGSYMSSSLSAALDPEVQSGFEGGAELYFGRALTIQVTRFDQRATGLIQNVALSVDTFARGATTERRVRYQLQNVGEISNRGWELQARANRGAFSLSSAFSSVDSRVRAVANGYNGDLRSGDRMLAVPARTASLTASYAGGGWVAALGATQAFDWVNYDRIALAKAYAGVSELPSREYVGPHLRDYWIDYNGEMDLRFTAARDLTRGISLLVTGENLLGGQLGEPDNVTIRAGRTITGGLRASF